ncbi:MAG: hypothetical protein ACWGQW_18190, partial [bacterium]
VGRLSLREGPFSTRCLTSGWNDGHRVPRVFGAAGTVFWDVSDTILCCSLPNRLGSFPFFVQAPHGRHGFPSGLQERFVDQ